MNTTTKAPWTSKTLILNAVLALAVLFVPSVATYISANPTLVALAFSGINIILRLVTKGAIAITDDSGNAV